jgi:hypothetical protein
VCLAVASPIVRAAPPAPTNCIAAGCTNSYWGSGQIAAGFGAPLAFQPGQTFTPQFTGALHAVRLGLETSLGHNVNAVVEIRTTVNGLPAATILAEAPVPGAPYAAGVLHAADFTAQNIVLTAGTRYALTLRSGAHQYILAAYPACFTSTGAADYVHTYDGQTWEKLATRDRSIIFEVCLDAATPTRTSTWGRVKAIYR